MLIIALTVCVPGPFPIEFESESASTASSSVIHYTADYSVPRRRCCVVTESRLPLQGPWLKPGRLFVTIDFPDTVEAGTCGFSAVVMVPDDVGNTVEWFLKSLANENEGFLEHAPGLGDATVRSRMTIEHAGRIFEQHDTVIALLQHMHEHPRESTANVFLPENDGDTRVRLGGERFVKPRWFTLNDKRMLTVQEVVDAVEAHNRVAMRRLGGVTGFFMKYQDVLLDGNMPVTALLDMFARGGSKGKQYIPCQFCMVPDKSCGARPQSLPCMHGWSQP